MKKNRKFIYLGFLTIISLMTIMIFLHNNYAGKNTQDKIAGNAATGIETDNSDSNFLTLYYQPRKNLQVGINFNLELMQIAAAHSANFKHKGYVGSDSKINKIVKQYFKNYPKKDYEKDLYLQSMDGIVNKLYHGETDYILCYDKKLDKMIYHTDRPDVFANSGKIQNQYSLISVIKDFKSYTKADSYFTSNKSEYENIMNNFRNRYRFDFIGQIQELTGLNMDNSEFKMVLSPSMEGGMALSLKDLSGKDIFLNITNPTDTYENTLNTLYHEEIHNFIMPVLLKRWSDYDNKRFIGVLNQNTGDNGNAFNETLTRALTNIVLEKYHPVIDTNRLFLK